MHDDVSGFRSVVCSFFLKKNCREMMTMHHCWCFGWRTEESFSLAVTILLAFSLQYVATLLFFFGEAIFDLQYDGNWSSTVMIAKTTWMRDIAQSQSRRLIKIIHIFTMVAFRDTIVSKRGEAKVDYGWSQWFLDLRELSQIIQSWTPGIWPRDFFSKLSQGEWLVQCEAECIQQQLRIFTEIDDMFHNAFWIKVAFWRPRKNFITIIIVARDSLYIYGLDNNYIIHLAESESLSAGTLLQPPINQLRDA